ncbi:MAG: LexA family protein [Vulcanimicrobiota bacterium]
MAKKSEDPTPIQKKIVEFIEKCIRTRGIPPSIKEIGSSVGLSSSSSVHHQLQNLERLGLIRRDPTKSRCIEIVKRTGAADDSSTLSGMQNEVHGAALPAIEENTADTVSEGESPLKEQIEEKKPESHQYTEQITAPHDASDAKDTEEKAEIHRYPLFIYESSNTAESDGGQNRSLKAETILLPIDFVGTIEAFLLEMDGDSMKEAGILEGDFCIIRQGNTPRDGDIVACKIDEEVTIKRFFNGPGYYILEPENHRYRRILVKDALFLGRVIGVLRNWERKTGNSQDL